MLKQKRDQSQNETCVNKICDTIANQYINVNNDKHAVRIENTDNLLFFAVRNTLYCMDRRKIVCKFENICYKCITDITVHKNVIFISSVDGLLSSIRFFD